MARQRVCTKKSFQPIFASKTHFQNPKVPPGLPGPSTRVPRPESFLRLRCRRKGGQYAVRCSVVAHLMLTPGPLGCVQPAFDFCLKERHTARKADLACVLKADLGGTSNGGLLCPSPDARVGG